MGYEMDREAEHINGFAEGDSKSGGPSVPPFEPIAIIGMGCRWPGDCDQPSKLWDFLIANKHGYSDFPTDRVNTKAFYHPKIKRPGSFYLPGGGFLKSDPYDFDRSFFGLSAQEATSMDPSQRKLLEVMYEAIESSGISLEELSGSKTGCFVGNFNNDHQIESYRDAEYPAPLAVSGNSNAILANRFNFLFNLRGPSMTMDTACSSSLCALHYACSSIHAGDCNAAFVGGSNLCLTPDAQIISCTLGSVSATGRCHTFDASADGYARSDGIGVLYIKRLEDAIRDQDHIRAVIRATASNTNGKTAGITHPNADGQERLIRHAYARARLAYSDLGYFECHGPGTEVGDPTEFDAMGRIFAEGRTTSNPLLVGSIKSNFGHTEAASGMAGIMKVILALENAMVPANFGFESPNPDIDFKDGRLKIVTKNEQWPDVPARIASLQSLGFGGSNAHAIVEAAETFMRRRKEPIQMRDEISRLTNGTGGVHIVNGINGVNGINAATSSNKQIGVDGAYETTTVNGVNGNHHDDEAGEQINQAGSAPASTRNINTSNVVEKTPDPRQYLLIFAAHNEMTLKGNVTALQRTCQKWRLPDLAYTLSARRTALPARYAIVAAEANIKESLEPENVIERQISESQAIKLGFVFTGQGAQWPQMGSDLLVAFPVYLATIRYLDNILRTSEDPPTWTLEEIIRTAEENELGNAELSQSVTTASQIALVELLDSWNIRPSVTIGHSSGEIGAAYAAGLLTMEEAIMIAYLRGKCATENRHDGLMLAIGKGHTDLVSELNLDGKDAIVACYNSPESVTLSGKSADILAVKAILDESGIFNRVLATGGQAYHSHYMQTSGFKYEQKIIKRFGTKLNRDYNRQRATFVSSVTGRRFDEDQLRASYWRQNLESPVLFYQAVEELVSETSIDVLVEIGPHAALKSSIQQISKAKTFTLFPEYISTMIRKKDNVQSLLRTAGSLWTIGYPIDALAVNDMKGAFSRSLGRKCTFLTHLPRYQWQYTETLRRESRLAREWRQRMHPRHDILGSRAVGGLQDDSTWRNVLRLRDVPWLGDHRLGDQIVFPAAGFICMALEAAAQTYELLYDDRRNIRFYRVETMAIHSPLIVPEDDYGIEVLLTLHPSDLKSERKADGHHSFRIVSVATSNNEDTFIEHAKGTVSLGFEEEDVSMTLLASKGVRTPISFEKWYDSFAQRGLNYGPSFQGLTGIKSCITQRVAEARAPLVPTGTDLSNESGYVIHPAAIDSFLQLSIIAFHSGVASRLKARYVPVSFERFTIRPTSKEDLQKLTTLAAKTSNFGTKTFQSELMVTGVNRRSLIDIKGLELLKSDHGSLIQSSEQNPYSRMVWQPSFRFFDSQKAKQFFPPVELQGAIVRRLNKLALLQSVQFYATQPIFFTKPQDVPHLQNLLDWIVRKRNMALHSQDPGMKTIFDYSDSERAEVIAQMTSALDDVSSESRLMCHIYKNLPAIMNQDISGIQIALQDNRLVKMYETGSIIAEGNRRLASIMELLSHENSRLRILEVGAGTGSATREILPRLKGKSSQRRYKKYVYTDVTSSFLHNAKEEFKHYHGLTFSTYDMEKPASTQKLDSNYDVVIASNVVHVTSNILSTLRNLRSILQVGGKLILLEITTVPTYSGICLGTFSDFWSGSKDPTCPRIDAPFITKDSWKKLLPQAGFSGADFFLDDYVDEPSSSVIVATAVHDQRLLAAPEVPKTDGFTLVYRGEQTQLISAFVQHTTAQGYIVDLLPVAKVWNLMCKRVIFLMETGGSLFIDITGSEWKGLLQLLKEAESALWVTNGSLLSGREPLHAMISGIVRGLKTENSQRRISVLDLDHPDADILPAASCDVILKLAGKSHDELDETYTLDYRYRDGVIYTSSLQTDDALNEEWRSRSNFSTDAEVITLGQLQDVPVKLGIDENGAQSSLVFTSDEDFVTPLPEDHLEVRVKASSVDQHTLNSTDNSLKECAGVVAKVGQGVHGFILGDHVFGLCYSKTGNIARMKVEFCQPMGKEDVFQEVASLPLDYCAALYGLQNLAKLEKGESVLLMSANSGVGLAGVQLAQLCGAKVYATVRNELDKQALEGCGVPEDHIFISSRKAWTAQLLKQTEGVGVDVMLLHPESEVVEEHWQCLAPFGRYIEVNRISMPTRSVSAKTLSPNHSYMSFDLDSLTRYKPNVIQGLMATIRELYHQGTIRPTTSTTFSIADIEVALEKLRQTSSLEKIMLSFQNQEDTVQFRSLNLKTLFDSEAAYLLVGCLTGLGQLYSRWMIDKGAKNLVFLARSGDEKAEVREFVDELRALDVDVRIVKGDVAILKDVEAAITCTHKPIKGVVQAALMLQDQSFENMSVETFHATMQPRVQGTLNLHTSTKSCPLDFFLLWSSWTAIFGTATQTNYLASCAFMDAFARHRRSLGLPATSLTLSRIGDIGAVGRNARYGHAMMRNGFYGNDEDEFLQYCQSAIEKDISSTKFAHDELTQAHLLAGIEAEGLRRLDQKGHPIAQMGWYRDARFSNLIQTVENLADESGQGVAKGTEGGEDVGAEDGVTTVERVRRRIAQLLYVGVDALDVCAPLSKYGMDSMIAAEMRNWLFANFGQDVSLFKMLSPTVTIEGLVEEMGVGK